MRQDLDGILARYGLGPEVLYLVPSVAAWSREKGYPEENDLRLAKAVWNHDRSVVAIAMSARLHDHFIGTTTTFFHLDFDDYRWLESDSRRAAKHLLLHEIAHVCGFADEAAADIWAIQELKAIEEES